MKLECIEIGSTIEKNNGELPERLKEQIANLSSRNWCVGSNPTLSSIDLTSWCNGLAPDVTAVTVRVRVLPRLHLN